MAPPLDSLPLRPQAAPAPLPLPHSPSLPEDKAHLPKLRKGPQGWEVCLIQMPSNFAGQDRPPPRPLPRLEPGLEPPVIPQAHHAGSFLPLHRCMRSSF